MKGRALTNGISAFLKARELPTLPHYVGHSEKMVVNELATGSSPDTWVLHL